MEKIVKDVGDIQSRLIDHRPVLQGEIRFFIREFEEKRAFRECRLLENLNKMTSDTNEHDLPRCTESMHEKLCDLMIICILYVDVCVQNTHLQVCAERRKQNWEEFLKEQSRLKEEVDEEHAKAVGRLSAQYNDMKKDLAKYSSF
uniref:Biogenesis of lysosome-related organelles complex 1 subunit 5 n=1 Tax=Sinocyclocheilus rhinocerous TaxID=307959 RepID=A0A673JDB0_9TELE